LDVTASATAYGQLFINSITSSSSIRSAISLTNQETKKWLIGNDYSSNGTNNFFIYDSSQSLNRLLIDTNGNVGIGSTAPAGLLDVEGAHPILLNGLNNAAGNVGIGTTSPNTLLQLYQSASPGIQFEMGDQWGTYSIGRNGGTGFLNFNGTQTGNVGYTFSGGNVGIGTTSPTAPLHVVGPNLGSVLGTTSNLFTLQNGNGNTSFLSFYQLRSSNGNDWTTTTTRIQQVIDTTGMGYMDFNPPNGTFAIAFGSGTCCGSTTVANEYMRIAYGGNVGIGMVSPGSTLQVNGNAVIGYSTNTAGPSNGLLVSGNVGIGVSPSSYNLQVAGTIYGSNTVSASDGRLKQNIKPLTGTLSKLDQLRGVSFEWNRLAVPLRRKEGEKGIGMIAQELQKVYPELVTGSKKNYLGINYGAFTAVLLQSIKELKSQVITMQDQINALQREVKTLEKQK